MLTLKVVTCDGCVAKTECDSVHITVADDEFGGSYGIRAGHARSVFALARGRVLAYIDGRTVLDIQTGAGFATADNDVITVVVNEYNKK